MRSNIQKANERSVEAFREFGGVLKHAARELLWLPEAKSLREEKKRYLTYFTLPGKWAWDIFFFERNGILEKRGRGFPHVRFCDNNTESYATAKRLLGNTVGKRENFEDVVLNGGREFWDEFPYDLYNLDFCGTCFPDEQPPFSDTFEAITRIIENHVSQRHFPFSLLLTMKALADETSIRAQEELKANIETNRADVYFADQINEVIPDTEKFVRANFADFILISIAKIICHLAKAHCDVEIRNRAKYPRQDGAYFITKFVFRFTGREGRSLRIASPMYASNVLKAIALNNVMSIDKSCISREIKRSHSELVEYVRSKYEEVV
jgi:hypothetical protein